MLISRSFSGSNSVILSCSENPVVVSVTVIEPSSDCGEIVNLVTVNEGKCWLIQSLINVKFD